APSSRPRPPRPTPAPTVGPVRPQNGYVAIFQPRRQARRITADTYPPGLGGEVSAMIFDRLPGTRRRLRTRGSYRYEQGIGAAPSTDGCLDTPETHLNLNPSLFGDKCP